MARNGIESEFRSSKMSAGDHFVNKIQKMVRNAIESNCWLQFVKMVRNAIESNFLLQFVKIANKN